MRWCYDLEDLIGLLAYVSVYAPDEFPDEDGEVLDLESAFSELDHGLQISIPEIRDLELVEKVQGLILASRKLYQSGNVTEAAARLTEAQYALRSLA